MLLSDTVAQIDTKRQHRKAPKHAQNAADMSWCAMSFKKV